MTQADPWEKSMACVLSMGLGECVARIPEACQCRKMPGWLYKEALKRLTHERDNGEKMENPNG